MLLQHHSYRVSRSILGRSVQVRTSMGSTWRRRTPLLLCLELRQHAGRLRAASSRPSFCSGPGQGCRPGPSSWLRRTERESFLGMKRSCQVSVFQVWSCQLDFVDYWQRLRVVCCCELLLSLSLSTYLPMSSLSTVAPRDVAPLGFLLRWAVMPPSRRSKLAIS